MKLVSLLALILLSCGCPARDSNDAIIKETTKCHDAGLVAEAVRNADGLMVRVQCAPPKE